MNSQQTTTITKINKKKMELSFNVEQLLWILLYQTDSEGLDQLILNTKG